MEREGEAAKWGGAAKLAESLDHHYRYYDFVHAADIRHRL
jgi:hypothetical protein